MWILTRLMALSLISHLTTVQRKLTALQCDSKADPSVVAAAEEAAAQIDSIAVKCSNTQYKTRALRQVAVLLSEADTMTPIPPV